MELENSWITAAAIIITAAVVQGIHHFTTIRLETRREAKEALRHLHRIMDRLNHAKSAIDANHHWKVEFLRRKLDDERVEAQGTQLVLGTNRSLKDAAPAFKDFMESTRIARDLLEQLEKENDSRGRQELEEGYKRHHCDAQKHLDRFVDRARQACQSAPIRALRWLPNRHDRS